MRSPLPETLRAMAPVSRVPWRGALQQLRSLRVWHPAWHLMLAACAVSSFGARAALGQAVAEPPVQDETAQEQASDAPGAKWVRLQRDPQGQPLAMQTAIVRYVAADDYQQGKEPAEYVGYVDLVGAVHIGDAAYYRELNRRFDAYDAVLYELVAPQGTVVPRGRGTSSSNPLGALQNGMKSMLEVEHQLEKIDYTRANFIHADLSPDEFLAAMERRDEGFLEMYFRMVGSSLAHQSQQSAQGESADLDIMAALFATDRARKLKIAMAKQFENMETLMVGLSGPDGSTLITDRNQRALDVLKDQLTQGTQRIAIFYGAGHLAEMGEQMAEQFDYRPVSVEWLTAWDLDE